MMIWSIVYLLLPYLVEGFQFKVPIRRNGYIHQYRGVYALPPYVDTDLTNDDAEKNSYKRENSCSKSNAPVYTYQSGARKVSFKIDESPGISDSFAPAGRFRKAVPLPGAYDDEDEVEICYWKKFLDIINDVTPEMWDVTTMARSNRRTRLLRDRAYAKPEAFATDSIGDPPGLKDLSPPKRKDGDVFWITNTARIIAFLVSYTIFPFMTRVLDGFVTMPPEKLDDITSKFGPGISILYGTFISLTLSILYRRLQEIQDDVAIESSMLVLMTRNLLALFRNDVALLQEAGQCSADQIRTLVKGSRGGELILLMYSDPYARMLELVDCYEEKLVAEGKSDLSGKAVSQFARPLSLAFVCDSP